MRASASVAVWVFTAVSPLVATDDARAPWPYAKPLPVEPPSVVGDQFGPDGTPVRNGIDRFVRAKLDEAGLEPAPQASRTTLLRRLYFDLVGLPPTPEEVAGFLADEDPKAYEQVVDRLLDDARYGERWGRYWLDLARYADTAGYEGDPDTPHAWRYRDYVIDSFNRDKPYDVFIKEQIAGDEFREIMGAGGLPDPDPEKVVAMTFLRLAPFTEPRGDETRHEMLSEMTATVSSVFLGLTVGCAKCHDHKYDQIPTKDFYRMKAFFATVQMPPPEKGDAFQIGGALPAKFYREGEKEWANELRARYEQDLEGARQAKTAYEKTLERKTAAAGIEETIGRAIRNTEIFSDAERDLYDELRHRERLLKMRVKRLLPVAMSLRHSIGPPYEAGVPTSRIMVRGEYDNPGEVVEPGFLSAVTGSDQPAHIRLDPFKRWPTRSRRMTLAQWIASPDNPLTARVLVNRLWNYRFGRGIVATPSDFGVLSGGPSHPELLDWLANEFVASGWSIKAMHRLMVTSATYRQASRHQSDAALAKDPENELLWRFRRQRLEAEAVRDSILAVSGRLNPEQFGLPVFPQLPGDLAEMVKYSQSKWDTDYGPESRKRSIYVYQQRTLNMPLMDAFDAIVCDTSRPRRRASVTALQALELYNGNLVNREVKHFAARFAREAGEGADRRAQIERGFLLALSRRPTEMEIAILEDVAAEGTGEDQLVGVARVLLNSNEFVYID